MYTDKDGNEISEKIPVTKLNVAHTMVLPGLFEDYLLRSIDQISFTAAMDWCVVHLEDGSRLHYPANKLVDVLKK